MSKYRDLILIRLTAEQIKNKISKRCRRLRRTKTFLNCTYKDHAPHQGLFNSAENAFVV